MTNENTLTQWSRKPKLLPKAWTEKQVKTQIETMHPKDTNEEKCLNELCPDKIETKTGHNRTLAQSSHKTNK